MYAFVPLEYEFEPKDIRKGFRKVSGGGFVYLVKFFYLLSLLIEISARTNKNILQQRCMLYLYFFFFTIHSSKKKKTSPMTTIRQKLLYVSTLVLIIKFNCQIKKKNSTKHRMPLDVRYFFLNNIVTNLFHKVKYCRLFYIFFF